MNYYEILSGDKVCAVWENNSLTVTDSARLPLYLKHFSDVPSWLCTRAIDSHRTNSRLLKKALRITEKDDLSTVIAARGVTITDNYWIREKSSSLHYDDVKFDESYFRHRASQSAARLALTGNPSAFNSLGALNLRATPELTNIGSFEKCWKNKDGVWLLYKKASRREAFSEIFISRLCEELGISCARYEKGDGCVITQDFTKGKYNFEPAFSFMGDDEDYENTFNRLNGIFPNAIPDFVRMIFLDALVMNTDRHTGNFGLMRDRASGEIVGFSPLFDHNMALISRGYPTAKVNEKDFLISLLCGFLNGHTELKKYIPTLTEKDIDNALSQTNIKARESFVKDYILKRYEIINSLLH